MAQRLKQGAIALALAFACVVTLGGTAAALVTSPTPPSPPSPAYIVQLADPPAASYRGGVPGLAATQVPDGARLRAGDAGVRAYVNHLAARRHATLAALGGGVTPLQAYHYAFNGFSARLTPTQARRLRGLPGVVAVTRDEERRLSTSRTPVFLGLDSPDGVWSERAHGSRLRGEDIAIGVIDTGIQPEDASFSDRQDAKGNPTTGPGTVVYGPPPAGWTGGCTAGPGFDPAKHCNHKLIGAKAFDAGFRAGELPPSWFEFVGSPRDAFGHGSHTASTAAGNQGVNTRFNAGHVGKISGMAPRARIAVYKACWSWVYTDRDGDFHITSCHNSDTVAAIDAALADGVDVINYSIAGTQTDLLDPVEIAFKNASAAGVFVAAGAANYGPTNTVNHPSPWVTTVAASTHDRLLKADVTLGNGAVYDGASMSPGLAKTPLVLASGDDPKSQAVQFCFNTQVLDPAKMAGKVVVCDNGAGLVSPTEQSAAVRNAGGVGMLLLNVPSTDPGADALHDDPHWVPTVQLPMADRDAVRAYAALPGATAALGVGVQSPGVIAPVMTSFSSRGPNLAVSDVLKPDLSVPGFNILAAWATGQADVAAHDAIAAGTLVPKPSVIYANGTSMSTPHVAGLAALLKQRWPTMSPAKMKSALMTTATGVKLADGSPDPDLNGYGAGHANLPGALDPGLVYPIQPGDYDAYLCGKSLLPPTDPLCKGVKPLPGERLNLPSFSADVPGSLVFERRVHNLGPAATYTASVSLPGFDATVSPPTLAIGADGSAKFTLALKANGATPDTRSQGSLTWSDGVHAVRSPILVRPTLFGGPAALASQVAGCSVPALYHFGFAGPLSHQVGGLTEATRQAGKVAKSSTSNGWNACAAGGADVAKFSFEVPAGTLVSRFALYDADTASGGQDNLDLYLFNPAGIFVSMGTGPGSDEMLTMIDPAPGRYSVCVHGLAPADGVSTTFTLSSWILAPGGALLASGVPGSVAIGDTAAVKLSWTAAAAGKRYLGALSLVQGADAATGLPLGTTLLSVEPATTPSVKRSGDGQRPAATRAAR